jgi:hypothetical protein
VDVEVELEELSRLADHSPGLLGEVSQDGQLHVGDPRGG